MTRQPAGAEDSWQTTYCRVCFNTCGLRVRATGDEVLEIAGDPEQPLAQGYTCVKGRSQAALLRDPTRLLRTLKRAPDGTLRPIPVDDALSEIAERLRHLLDEFGPTSVASYYGTMATTNSATGPILAAFMDAIESPMRFSPNTIDKPGKMVAQALHGSWQAPSYEYAEPAIALLFGLNPLIAYQGVPRGNPASWIRAAVRRGMELVVVDPRRTETARLATRHLQPPPGSDAEILAALIRIVLVEDLADHDFVAAHTVGIERLRQVVEPFTPEAVAARTGLQAADLEATARTFATRRGYVALGTGPNMSGPGVLVEYLALCLETLAGHWAREGDLVANAPSLLPLQAMRAEASSPVAAFGLSPHLTASGLSRSAAGVPIAGVPAQIEANDPRERIRALISCGGNPASAWPDQRRVVGALRRLDLLVQIDPWMSATSQLADYVIAPKLPLEVAGHTQVPLDNMTLLSNGYGLERSFAQWTDAVVAPPVDSDLIEEWEVYWGLAERLGLSLTITQQSVATLVPRVVLPGPKPTTEQLLTMLADGSRVPLPEVRRFPHGHEFVDDDVVVGPPIGPSGRLELGDPTMMADLADAAAGLERASETEDLRLICRRIQQVYNSSHHHATTLRGRRHNPAFMHPDDMADRHIDDGEEVQVTSATGSITAIAQADANLRPGVVSMTHCFGGLPDDEADVFAGSNIAQLVGLDALQPYTGQPVMSNVVVRVIPLGDLQDH